MRGARLWLTLGATGLVGAVAIFFSISPYHGSTPAQAGGATVTVNIGDDWFCDYTHATTPCTTNIAVGDTVQWVWLAGNTNSHSTTSDLGSTEVWTSGLPQSTGTFDHTFNMAGSFPYHCDVHANMDGVIVVAEAATPTGTLTAAPTLTSTPTLPLVTLLSPSPTATATPTPTPAGLTGDANKDGEVSSVDAALVLQYSAGLITSINPLADANENGEINPIDATLILQYVAGLIDQLPP